MQLNSINIKDKLIFDKFFSCRQHSLSAYAFENIFIWKNLYRILWTKIGRRLCVFFKDKVGCFLYLPPLGKDFSSGVARKCFEIMNSYNKNRLISRVENIEKNEVGLYKKAGFKIIVGGRDYICKKEDLVNLGGNLLKRKRATVNYFMRNYCFSYRPYRDTDRKESIDLFRLWMAERKTKNKDTVYQKLLEDNFVAFKTALNFYSKLKLVGRVIRVDGKIKAVTFGYPLGDKSFVVLFEVCNLKFKGIAQYIFREFSREQSVREINIMDDSGIDSLKRVKLSYHPYKSENNFIARNG
ncbi:DUF2156 domain-containing protein [Candidatus Omnitrophota bacterium]